MQELEIEYEMIAAYDNNAVANAVYRHNFGLVPTTTNLEHISTFPKADLWLLSPPCQPYTRGGKLLDDKDPRAAALMHLISVLDSTPEPPKWLFLENVLNFEKSKSRDRLMAVLQRRGYRVEELLISPLDPWVAIPNDRLRYYLAAERIAETAAVPFDTGLIITRLEDLLGPPPQELQCMLVLDRFLDSLEDDEDLSRYLVPQQFLEAKPKYRHDIIDTNSIRSATFTKAYGSKHLIGTGSLIQTKRMHLNFQPDDLSAISQIGLRFFTPREIARLHALPVDGVVQRQFKHPFSFPLETTISQQYRLLGNSLNVRVVSRILTHLLTPKNSCVSTKT